MLRTRTHKPRCKYNEAYAPLLQNVGLFHLSQIKHVPIDARLMTALAERWRPETHTFHLPVGEMTITLQDVSCLWGLPIKGTPIIGYSNIGAWSLVRNLLGTGESLQPFKINNSRNNDRSRYNISLKWLRHTFLELPAGSSDEVVDRYCRAYILDLFGSIVFPNDTDDSVPACYLQFLTDLRTQQNYNWGAAVLGMLYHELSKASRWDSKNIAGTNIFFFSKFKFCVKFKNMSMKTIV